MGLWAIFLKFVSDSCFLKFHLIPQDDFQSSLDDILWEFGLSFSNLNAHGITLTLSLISIVNLYHLKGVHWDCSPHLPTKNDIVSSITFVHPRYSSKELIYLCFKKNFRPKLVLLVQTLKSCRRSQWIWV